MTTDPGLRGTPPSRQGGGAGPRRARVRFASALAGVAVVLTLIAAFSPWWYATTSTPGTSTSAYYYPGTETRVVSSGGGGTVTYSEAHVPSLGVLYAAVLAGAFLLAVAAAVGAVYALRTPSREPSARPRRGPAPARVALLVAILCGLLLALVVPAVQPALFQSDNPSGVCSGPAPAGECTAFWGSSHSGLATTTWGAGSGWWLVVVGTALLGIALVLVISAGGSAALPVPEATSPSRPGARLESASSDPGATLPGTRPAGPARAGGPVLAGRSGLLRRLRTGPSALRRLASSFEPYPLVRTSGA